MLHVPYPEYEGSKCLQTAVNTTILLCAVAYPGIFFGGGGSTNSVEDRENRDLGAVAP